MCDRPYYVCIIALTVYALCYSTDSCADSAESERRLTEILDYLGLSDDSPMCGASLCTMADFLLTTRPGRKYCIWCMIVSFCYLSKNWPLCFMQVHSSHAPEPCFIITLTHLFLYCNYWQGGLWRRFQIQFYVGQRDFVWQSSVNKRRQLRNEIHLTVSLCTHNRWNTANTNFIFKTLFLLAGQLNVLYLFRAAPFWVF